MRLLIISLLCSMSVASAGVAVASEAMIKAHQAVSATHPVQATVLCEEFGIESDTEFDCEEICYFEQVEVMSLCISPTIERSRAYSGKIPLFLQVRHLLI
ncbi:MAG: hypothetical protein NTX15_01145 [Candidatus Kapabacteria bacterium]|nr:hypothetical protein [Candidatus Kapabacteria bacterium]